MDHGLSQHDILPDQERTLNLTQQQELQIEELVKQIKKRYFELFDSFEKSVLPDDKKSLFDTNKALVDSINYVCSFTVPEDYTKTTDPDEEKTISFSESFKLLQRIIDRFENFNISRNIVLRKFFDQYISVSERLGLVADFSNSDLQFIDLNKFKFLTNINCSGANFKSADLTRVNASESTFIGANLMFAQVMNANLQNANFRDAKMFEADLGHSDLSYADFNRADLRGADFKGADLTGANFEGADLTGANFTDAIIENTDFTDAIGYNSPEKEAE